MGKAWSERPTRRRRRKAVDFNPTHDDIQKAVKKYLDSGGEINHIAQGDHNIPGNIGGTSSHLLDDDFFFDCKPDLKSIVIY